MWEFMCKYVESFWKDGEYAWKAFAIILAWIVTIGVVELIINLIWAIGCIIAEKIKEN